LPSFSCPLLLWRRAPRSWLYSSEEGTLIVVTDPIEQGKAWVEDLIRKQASEPPVRLRWREERGRIAHTCTVSWGEGRSVSICIPVCYLYVTDRKDVELERYLTNRITLALRAVGRRLLR